MSLMRAVAGVLFFLSCEAPDTSSESASASPDADESPPLLTTDSTEYTLQWDGRGWFTTIRFEYQNSSEDTLYVVNCNQHVTLNVQKRDWLTHDEAEELARLNSSGATCATLALRREELI